jgi:hypothetical protein
MFMISLISLTINQRMWQRPAGQPALGIGGQIQIGATKIGQLVITPLTRIYYDNIYIYVYMYICIIIYIYGYHYIHIYS